MLDQGYNYRAISDIISRGFSTVVREVSRGGGKDKYNPDKEHELAGERHANMGNRIKTKQITTEKSGQLCNEDMENRLRNLEMQVEILAETCKRLVRKIE
jgi:IS30 family transposase